MKDPIEVLPISEARDEFSAVVARFRKEGLAAAPVIFGSHRKPEAVTIPYEMFMALLPAIEEIQLGRTIAERLAGPESSWADALSELGISQAEVDAVTPDKYVLTTE